MGFSGLGTAAGAGRTSDKLKPPNSPGPHPGPSQLGLLRAPASKLCRKEGGRGVGKCGLTKSQSSTQFAKRWWGREPGARRQAFWLLVQRWVSPTSRRSCCGSPGAGPSLTHRRPIPGEGCPHPALPVTHHPLHLLGHLVAAQVVVEGALGSPVWWVVPDGVGSLAIHLGDHGLLFFLGEQHRCISLGAGPTHVAFLIPRCLTRRPGVKAAAPLFSAQPGAQKSAMILELTQQSILIPPNSPKPALAGPGGQ